MMKKNVCMILTAAMVSMGLTGCAQMAGVSEVKAADNDKEKIQIVTTIYPEYDWVKQVLGNRAKDAEVTLLLEDGENLHTYEPTAEDKKKIEESDLFVYVGGESDEWAEAIEDSSDVKTINLMETLGKDAAEEDEHVWLSVKNAKEICKEISNTLGEIDPEHAADYKANLGAYMEKLNALDYEFKSSVNGTADKKLAVSDEKAFSNLLDDYSLSYADAKKVNTKNKHIVELNIMEDITEDSVDYVHLMGENLDILRQALRK